MHFQTHTHTHRHIEMAGVTHCSDLFIVVQIQWHSAAFVAPWVLSEAVSEAVTSDFLIPSTHFFFFFGTSMGPIVTNQPSSYSLGLSPQTPTRKMHRNCLWTRCDLQNGEDGASSPHFGHFQCGRFQGCKAGWQCDGGKLQKYIWCLPFAGSGTGRTGISWCTRKHF